MTSNRNERLELVTKRLEEELSFQNDFFTSCCELALGKKPMSQAYLSYRVCREQLGHKDGVYLCLLYAQLYSANYLLAEYGNLLESAVCDEFSCINRELLCQILLMSDQHDGPDQIRDTLYWFYSDYCELFVEIHAILLSANVKLFFGGPFLISPLDSKCAKWEQHIWDCGLYLGKRFEERFFQAVKKVFSSDQNEMLRQYVMLFPKEVQITESRNEGFLLTSWQRDQWKQMSTQLRHMAK